MDCKRRRRFTNELKKEIIQKLKDGISRSDIQKEYGISPSSLSRWICPPDEIIGNFDKYIKTLMKYIKFLMEYITSLMKSIKTLIKYIKYLMKYTKFLMKYIKTLMK